MATIVDHRGDRRAFRAHQSTTASWVGKKQMKKKKWNWKKNFIWFWSKDQTNLIRLFIFINQNEVKQSSKTVLGMAGNKIEIQIGPVE